jgi:hypothetical protein
MSLYKILYASMDFWLRKIFLAGECPLALTTVYTQDVYSRGQFCDLPSGFNLAKFVVL